MRKVQLLLACLMLSVAAFAADKVIKLPKPNLNRTGAVRDTKNAHTQLMGAMDAGIVSQNISIFCSAARLATVPRASMDINQLKKVLKLKESQVPMMNHPIGYLK